MCSVRPVLCSLALTLLFLTGMRSSVAAQEPASATVLNAVAHNDLTTALRQTRSVVAKAPRDPLAQETLGILLLADGKVKEAGLAFASALRIDPHWARTPTGLEGLAGRGSALYKMLARQKVTLSLNGGAAAARNNLGAVKLILNKAGDALTDLDEAARLRPGWGAPWANAAIAWLAMNKPQKAEDCAQYALDRGETSAKVYTALAESQYQLEKWDETEAYLKQAQEVDPDYPYALFLRSQLLKKTMHIRDSERALIQALAWNPAVAAEQRLVPTHNEFDHSGGGQSQEHMKLLSNGQPFGASYRLLLEKEDRQVEDRENAFQRRRFSQFLLGRPTRTLDSTVYATFLNEAGGVPGAQRSEIRADSFGFDRSSGGLVGRAEVGSRSDLLYHFGYRHDGASAITNIATEDQTLRDEQVILEARLDHALSARHKIQTGISYLQNRRQLPILQLNGGQLLSYPVYYTPVEPNEQALPGGYSGLWRFYAIDRQQPSSRMSLAYGPVAAFNNGSLFVLPYLDARYKLTPRRTLRFSILSRAMDAVGDLYPIETLPGPTPGNPPDQDGYETRDYNREPLLEGPNGRLTSYEINWTQMGRRGRFFSVTGFYRQYNEVLNLLEDPSLSFALRLAPISKAEITGIEFQIGQPLGPLQLDLYARFQTVHAIDDPASAFPQGGHLSNLPDQQTRLRVSVPRLGGWHIATEVVHTPPKNVLDLVADPPITATIPGTVSVNLFVRREISGGASLFLNIYGLVGHRDSYANYPSQPSWLGGINMRF